jgi:ABC-type Fe3+/spermidine/putrescine transport system ATPase subunit
MSIVLTDLTKYFGSQLVVSHLSLEIQEGELFVLLGSSGSGKSTILKLIAGLVPPDAGRIELNGVDVTRLPPQQRGVGFVFQNYSVFRHMSAARNIEFGLRIRGEPGADRRRRVEELLEVVGLVGLGDRFADQLSGGQLQRVALARALAYRPAVLLLDEPFGALDVKIRAQLRQSLREIQDQLGVTTVLVTHDQEEAFELGDRIGVLEHGHLVEVASPEALYHRPRSEYAGAFVGSGNVLVGRAEAGAIRLGSTVWPFPEGAPAHRDAGPVRILFRPESVEVRPVPIPAAGPLYLLGRGRVGSAVFAGPSLRLRLEVGGLEGVRQLAPPVPYGEDMTIIEASMPSRESAGLAAPGTDVWVGVREFHVLEPTGLNVLIVWEPTSAGAAALDVAGRIVQFTGGRGALLAVARDVPRMVAVERAANDWLDQQPTTWRRPSLRVRAGFPIAGPVLKETQEGEYELLVIARERAAPWPEGELYQALLEVAAVPVLLVRDSLERLDRVLICTGAGEPGKADVVFGGRLARHARAEVTVLHLYPPGADELIVGRGARHLELARATLESLGVACETRMAAHPSPAQGILEELASGGHDLLVIGAPARRGLRRTAAPDVTSRILDRSDRPVLIVPISE